MNDQGRPILRAGVSRPEPEQQPQPTQASDLERLVKQAVSEVEAKYSTMTEAEKVEDIQETIEEIDEVAQMAESFSPTPDYVPYEFTKEDPIVDNPGTELIKTAWAKGRFKSGRLVITSKSDGKQHIFNAKTEEEANAMAYAELSLRYEVSNLKI